MTTFKQTLQIVLLAVFALNTLGYSGIGLAMSGEMTTATMQGMNTNDCDDCIPGNVNCEICVFACASPFVAAINSSSLFLNAASLLNKLEGRKKYYSYISPIDPFPPRVLNSA